MPLSPKCKMVPQKTVLPRGQSGNGLCPLEAGIVMRWLSDAITALSSSSSLIFSIPTMTVRGAGFPEGATKCIDFVIMYKMLMLYVILFNV